MNPYDAMPADKLIERAVDFMRGALKAHRLGATYPAQIYRQVAVKAARCWMERT